MAGSPGKITASNDVELKHEAHIFASILCQFCVITRGQFFVEVVNGARRRHVESAQDVQQRGLATARRSEKDDKLVVVKFQAHTTQGMNFHLTHLVCLRDIDGAKDGGWRCGGRVHVVPKLLWSS